MSNVPQHKNMRSVQYVDGKNRLRLFLMVFMAIFFIASVGGAIQEQKKFSFVISTASAKGGAIYHVYPGHFLTVDKTSGNVAEVVVSDPHYSAFALIPVSVIFNGTIDETINVIGGDIANVPVDVLLRIAWGAKNEELFNLIISSRAGEIIEHSGIGDGSNHSNGAGMEALGLLYLQAMEKNEYERALDYLKTCGKKFPHDWWPYDPTGGPCLLAAQFGIADIYRRMGRFSEAEKLLFDIVISSYVDTSMGGKEHVYPAGFSTLSSLRQLWNAAKFSNEARVKKLDLLAAKIKNPSLHAKTLLMKTEYFPKNSRRYEETLLEVVNKGDGDYIAARALFEIGKFYKKNKSTRKLRALCMKVLSDPGAISMKIVAYYLIGKVLYDAGEYNKAYESLASAVLLEPSSDFWREFDKDRRSLLDSIYSLLQKTIANDLHILPIKSSLLYDSPTCAAYSPFRESEKLYVLSSELKDGRYWHHVIGLAGENHSPRCGWVPDDVGARYDSERCFKWVRGM